MSSVQMTVRVGIDGTTVTLTRREWKAAVLEVDREAMCRCGHPAYGHRIAMLGSNVIEKCDAAEQFLATCHCPALLLEVEVERRVAEWVVARRVGEALVG